MAERARSRRGARWINRTDRHHRTETTHRVPVRAATFWIDSRPARDCHAARVRFQIPSCPSILAAKLVDGDHCISAQEQEHSYLSITPPHRFFERTQFEQGKDFGRREV